jgi:hypothetical protein
MTTARRLLIALALAATPLLSNTADAASRRPIVRPSPPVRIATAFDTMITAKTPRAALGIALRNRNVVKPLSTPNAQVFMNSGVVPGSAVRFRVSGVMAKMLVRGPADGRVLVSRPIIASGEIVRRAMRSFGKPVNMFRVSGTIQPASAKIPAPRPHPLLPVRPLARR